MRSNQRKQALDGAFEGVSVPGPSFCFSVFRKSVQDRKAKLGRALAPGYEEEF